MNKSSCSSSFVVNAAMLFKPKPKSIYFPPNHHLPHKPKSKSHYRDFDKTLKALCFSGRLTQAVGLLCRSGLIVDASTYSLLLQESIFSHSFINARRIHAHMILLGYHPTRYLYVKLLIFYAKAGHLHTAHFIFNNHLQRFKHDDDDDSDSDADDDIVPWNALLSGYVQKGLHDLALALYDTMRQPCYTLRPDQYTFASLFKACAALALLQHGRLAHGLMMKILFTQNVVVTSALMDMYFKCSCPSDAHRVFNTCSERNVITWTALMSGFGNHGRVADVLHFFHNMLNEGFRPNHVTFLALLSACSHGGLVHQGWTYFQSMIIDYGIQPRGKHFAAVVDLLGRAGRLKEAYEFVLNSPCRKHAVIWGALLGASKIHGDMDLAKIAATNYFQLESNNAGKYVVLSNAYASFGLWENVAEIRGLMRYSGMKKEPSYSRIEIQQRVDFFYMGDNTHKQYEEIHNMIKQLTCVLKDAGYIPDDGLGSIMW